MELLQKLFGFQLVKKFFAFYGTRTFITTSSIGSGLVSLGLSARKYVFFQGGVGVTVEVGGRRGDGGGWGVGE
jgi:hypothetical protein